MPLSGLSSLARMEAAAAAAAKRLRNFLHSTTLGMTERDIENLRRDAEELRCTAPFVLPAGPETDIG